MNVILYTIHCPRCKNLQMLLDQKHIKYEIFDDKEVMKEMGIMQSPVLKVGDDMLDFNNAIRWIRSQNN